MAKKRELPAALRANADKLKRGEALKGGKKKSKNTTTKKSTKRRS